VCKYLVFAYLEQLLLPAYKGMLSDTFAFQQDSALAHWAPETVELLSRATPDFISPDQWLSNSADLNPPHYKTWVVMQQSVHKT